MEKPAPKKGKPDGMDETDYLLSSPANARRLRESIQEFKRGEKVIIEWTEDGRLEPRS